jgi:two-component sensor histidine kinase
MPAFFRRFLLLPLRHGPRSRLYLLACAIGWTAYTLLNLSALYGIGKLAWGTALDLCLLSVILAAATHYLLGSVRLYDWHAKPLAYTLPRVLGLIVLLALLSLLLSIAVEWGIKHSHLFALPAPEARFQSWVWYLLPAINISILFILATAIDFIGHAFRRLREREVAQWKAEAALKAAELRQLKNQINPHFTFNALNNIRALISEDPQRARQMVTHLAEVLRYVLYHAERESVTLEQELEVVTAYLALETIQQEQRLRIEWRIAPEAQALRLPPMALQILVENAIKHGIARRPEGGTLRIGARRDGAALCLEVGNPGALEQKSGEGGFGLAYVRERLREAGGDLSLRGQDGDVRAVLRIPQTGAAAAATDWEAQA